MTDKKLSQLPAGTAIAPTDLFYSAQDIGGGLFTQVKQSGTALGIRKTVINAVDYYVATTGSDSNNGSIGSPWLTHQHAIDTVVRTLAVDPDNIANFTNITIHTAAGVYDVGQGIILPDVMQVFQFNRTGWNNIILTGDFTTPANVTLFTTTNFAVISALGSGWVVSGFTLRNDSPQGVLVYCQADLFCLRCNLDNAGNTPLVPATQGVCFQVQDGCMSGGDFTITGVQQGFAFIKGESTLNAAYEFGHGYLHLNVDPKWPSGTFYIQRFGKVFYNPSGGVTGTSSGPQVNIEASCVMTTTVAMSSVPGVASANVIHGRIYSAAGSELALLGGSAAFTAPDNSGTITQVAPNSVTAWTLTLPTTAGTNNFVLKTNGSGVTDWVAQTGGGTPAGSNLQVQYNNAGAFGGYTNTQLTALINQFTATLPGDVPLSGGGTTNFLRADGSWVAPPTGGTLTIGTSAISGSTANDVLYGDGALLQQAAQFQITSGQPNVRSGNSYLYNSVSALKAVTANKNWFFANSGNLTLSGTDNYAIGDGALVSLTTGSTNAALGSLALAAITTATDCTAFGYGAGQSITGNQNTAFGRGALGAAATSGFGNLAMGRNALQNCTSGQENNAIGSAALGACTTGSQNSADGENCMVNLTIGTGNTANGWNTMGALTSGVDNTGAGVIAMRFLTTGSSNSGFGRDCLTGCATGSNNVAMGISAGYSGGGDIGSDNIFIGAFTGFALGIGVSRNIIIGNNAGGNISTGWNNTVIGYSCDIPGAGTVNDQLSIKNYIYGTGLNGSGSTISSGKIGIGVKAPAVELDVAGSINVLATKAYQYANGNAIFSVNNSAGVAPDWYFGGAGNFTVTASGVGGNFCEGPGAGAALTTGFWNMVEGSQAFSSATTAHGCLAFGKSAMASLVSGQDNAAVGTGALSLATGGDFHLAVGVNALHGVLTTGSQGNIAIGNSAGLSLAGTSSQCLLLGGGAAQSMTSGAFVICLGPNSGQSLVSAAGNTVIIGDNAANSCTDGYQDTVIGSNAGSKLSNGRYSTIIGASAGGTTFASGQQTIIIGFSCDVPSASASGQISIGNMIYGTGCTGTGASASTGKIGIGTGAPNFVLDVLGSIGQKEAAFLIHTSVALTNGGAASSPTLGAAGPAGATTPTKWIPIDDNGTTRYVPSW